MAKLSYTYQAPSSTELDQPGATPAQFLPSMMLSWRAPIMARDRMSARTDRKPFGDSAAQQAKLQPVS